MVGVSLRAGSHRKEGKVKIVVHCNIRGSNYTIEGKNTDQVKKAVAELENNKLRYYKFESTATMKIEH